MPDDPRNSADSHEIWDLVSDGIYTLDASWRFTYLNPVAERGAGSTRDQLVGGVIWDLYPSAVGSDLWQAHQEAMASRQHRSLMTYSRAAGRLVQAHLRPMHDGGLLVLLRDVDVEERTQAELKAAEAGLAASEHRLRNITDALPVLIAYVDSNQRFQFANKAYEDRFNRPREHIVGHTLEEVFGADLYAQRRPYIERALNGEPVLYEVPFDGPGEKLETLVQHVPHFDANGGVVGFYALVQDITPVKRAEAALRESEARFDLAAQASALGVWEWRQEGDEILFSSRAKEIWGFGENETVTLAAVRERIHPDDRAEVTRQAARARDPALRERMPYRYRVRLQDGEVRWIKSHGAAVFETVPQGAQAVRYVGTMEDITQQQMVLEELGRSEKRLRLAIDAGRMAIWAIDPLGQVSPSPELNRIVGLPKDARPTMDQLRAQFYPGELERLQKIAADTLGAGERYFEAEYRHVRVDDGTVRWLAVRAEFQLDEQGAPAGSLGIVLDVTERKEAEERLKLLAGEVDHRANNLLAVVQGVIALTKGRSLEDYRQALTGRVSALARAHQLLASSRWTGADLKTLVQDELGPYASKGGPVTVQGPPLPLDPATAQSLAMAIHELATNAVKHGALAGGEGALSVTWTTPAQGEPCILEWAEVCKPVEGRRGAGFGMRVIARALDGQVGGGSEINWRDEGLLCRLRFPISQRSLDLAS